MRALLFLALAFTLTTGQSRADNKFSAKTATPAPTGVPTVITSPTPTRTPMVAPTWAPMEASTGDYHAPQKTSKSNWATLTNLGVSFPLSSDFQANYGSGFNVDIGTSYQFTGQFSGWFDLAINHFDSRNTAVTGNNNYTMVGLAALARVSLFPNGLSPFLFAGPGLMYNENRGNTATAYDPYTGNSYFPINGYEVDFQAVGGVGMEYRSEDGFTVFLQGKLTCDFVSSGFAASTATGSPLLFMPIQAGVAFGL